MAKKRENKRGREILIHIWVPPRTPPLKIVSVIALGEDGVLRSLEIIEAKES